MLGLGFVGYVGGSMLGLLLGFGVYVGCVFFFGGEEEVVVCVGGRYVEML